MRIIQYNAEIDKQITNLYQLAKGTGCRYLLCFISANENGETFIAKNWKRKIPSRIQSRELIVDFN